MKVAALLLSLYVLFLAGLPVLGMAGAIAEVICCAAEQEEAGENDGDGCGEICNPFLFCHCCPGFTPPVVAPVSRWEPDSYAIRNSRTKALSPRQLIFPVWHPPRA